MQEFGGFEIEFIKNIDWEYTRNLIKEIINGIAESWEQIEINDNANKIYVAEDSCIGFNEFDSLFEKICKMVASHLQNISFNGIAHYSNLSINYDMYNIITYRCSKKEMLIKKISGECLDGYCIKCGERLFNPPKGIVSNVYYCDNCKENIKFDINFNEYILSLKNGIYVKKT